MTGSRPRGNCFTYWFVGAMNCTSKSRTAVIVPSAVDVYPVLVVPTWIRFVVGSPPERAFASSFVMSAATAAVTVAETSVSSSSHLIGVAAAEPSNEIPHSLIFARIVALGFTWSIVLMAVPVVTAACAAVVGMGPFAIRYSAMIYLLLLSLTLRAGGRSSHRLWAWSM